MMVPIDIRMPKLDGIELLRHMKFVAALKAIPVALLTSYNWDMDPRACYQLGVNPRVVKPVGFAPYSEASRPVARCPALTSKLPAA